MRSGWRACGCVWLCLALAQPQPLHAATATAGPASRERVQRVVERLRADPDISGLRERMRLHWLSGADEDPDQPPQGWRARLLQWLAAATAWLAASSRLLLLITLALAAAIVAVWALRIWRQRPPAASPAAPPQTLVRQRADEVESWPADIVAAARAHWQRGDPRGALQLLYRGLLRALAQRHGLAVAPSATEGECLALLRAAPIDVGRFGGGLISVWQRAAYAQAPPSEQRFAALCADFDRLLVQAGAAGP